MTSVVVSSGGAGPIQMDNENLRRKLALQREENGALMRQNQELLQSMEKLTWEFSKAQGKIRGFDAERGASVNVTAMKEKVFRLEADNRSLEERLAEANQHCSELQHLLDDVTNDKGDWKSKLDRINQEFKAEREMRKKAESDHRACVMALEEAQRQVSRLSEETRERLSDAEAKVRGLETQLREARAAESQRRELITRLSGVEEERNRLRRTAKDCEEKDMEILNLRTEVARLKQRGVQREAEADAAAAARLDAETRVGKEAARAEALQKELLRLEQERDQIRQQAGDWQRQVDEGCAKLCQLEHTMDSMAQTRAADVQRLTDEVTDLRRQISDRDEDLARHRERAKTASQTEGSLKGDLEATQVQVASLRSQLERSSERASELEHLVARHEDEAKRNNAEVAQLRQDNSRLACDLASVEQRLSLRDSRVAELTKEAEKLRETEARLEKELREASTRAARAETRASELKSEVDEMTAQARAVEDKMQRKDLAASDLQAEHQLRGRQLDELRSELSNARLQHAQQLRERQQYTDELTDRLEKLRIDRQAMGVELERQQAARAAAEAEVVATAKRLHEVEMELAEQSRRSESALQTLEKRAASGSEHMQKLQEELKSCMTELQTLYSSQQWYESELRTAKANAESQKAAADEAARAVNERQKRLDASHRRVEAAERKLREADSTAARVPDLEAQLEERQRLLDAAQNRAAECEAQLRRHKESTREVEAEVGRHRGEAAAAQRDLATVRLEADATREEHQRELAARAAREKSLRADMARLDAELTRAVHERDDATQAADLSRRREQELEQRAVRAETELHGAREELCRVASQLESTRGQVQTRSERLAEVETNLRRAEATAAERARDVATLENSLRSRTGELEKRAAQLRSLEANVETHTRERNAVVSELEGELVAVREQMGKQATLLEEELVEKEKMQASMAEKTELMRLAESKLRQLSKETEKRGKRNRELQEDVRRMAEERNGLLHEVRGMKEDAHGMGADLKMLKERLTHVEREKERLAQCLEESTKLLGIKGDEATALSEEVNSLRIQHAQVESRAEAEMRQLRRDIDELRVQRHTEMGQLKEESHEQLTRKAHEMNSLNDRLQKVETDLTRANQELFRRDETIGDLQDRLREKEQALRDASETMTVKNSTIARLEAKLNQSARQHGVQMQELRSRSNSPVRPADELASPPAASAVITQKPPRSPGLADSPKHWEARRHRGGSAPPPERRLDSSPGAPIASDDPGIQSLLRRVNARIDAREQQQQPAAGLRRSADWSETMGEVSELESEDGLSAGTPSLAARELEATEAKLAALQARLQKVQTAAEQDPDE